MSHRILIAAACLTCWALPAAAQSGAASVAPPPPEKHVQASLVAENAVAPGGEVTVALRQVIAEEWHTYWRNPGDSGQATTITWHLPPGWGAGDIQWPYPSRIPTGPVMNFAYAKDVMLLTQITAPKDAKAGEAVPISADVTWLVCKDVCIPEDAHLDLMLDVAAPPPAPDAATEALFTNTRSHLPRPSPWKVTYSASDKSFLLGLDSADLAAAVPKDAAFFPYTDGIVEAAQPQTVQKNDKGLVLSVQPGWRLATPDKRRLFSDVAGVLVLTSSDGTIDAFEVNAPQGAVASGTPLARALGIGFWQALLFAFIGGLILNLMPCVLPILSMKALALARKAGAEKAAHSDSLAYGAGVLVCFGVLAGILLGLRGGGEAVGWGFQLQEPIVVASFALLMFAVGLNLSGLFEIGGGRFAGMGQTYATKGGAVGSFFTGVLAVAVATPCTAPFMGAAMGFALVQPAIIALGVFFALGLGFALPFIVLGYSPGLLGILPRPGAWMVIFKQFLAFPMYAAAIWLVWVLSQQIGPDGVLGELAAALALGFALWAYGASQRAGGIGQIVALAAAVLGLAAMVFVMPVHGTPAQAGTSANAAGKLGYEKFSAAKLAELRAAGRPVFVNATAAWCITCLANERVALSSDTLAADFAAHNVATLKADWTNRDPEITALLATQGRDGVPLYLYYAPHADAPVVLPQILTEGIVRDALGLSQKS